jgi:hypothetical protein
MKASPELLADGEEPTSAMCCEPVVDMCAGNKATNTDVVCENGYADKANKMTIMATSTLSADEKKTACCDKKTCDHVKCPSSRKKKSPLPTLADPPTADPTEDQCCEDYTGMCAGNTNGNVVKCLKKHPALHQDKPHKASIKGTTAADCCDSIGPTCMSFADGKPFTCGDKHFPRSGEMARVVGHGPVEGKDCANNLLDVKKFHRRVGYGPVCPRVLPGSCPGAPGCPSTGNGAAPDEADFARKECTVSFIMLAVLVQSIFGSY